MLLPKKSQQFTAMILAAGVGKRLGDFSRDIPKPLLKVGNKTLIEYSIDFVNTISIHNVIVVGGYHFHKLQAFVQSVDPSILLINNSRYEDQNLVSFAAGLEKVKNNTNLFVCNADYIFNHKTSEEVSCQLKGVVIFCSYDLSMDGADVMKVKVGPGGGFIRMSKNLVDYDCIYTGMFFFESRYIPEVKRFVKDMLQRYDKREATVEDVFKEYIKSGGGIKVADVGKADWHEIDTPEELKLAREAFAENQ